MKQKYILTGILIAALTLPASSFAAADSPVIDDGTMPVVVSLGDSYSSGEGIEPYYGQESSAKYRNEDWVCHRSELSWPGMLEVNGMTLSSVRGTNYSCADGLVSTEGTGENWYFGAVSGAVTKNIYSDNDQDRQAKTVSPLVGQRSDTRYQLNFQIDTITSLPDPSMVDYVTLTIGGNDVDFTGIITEAMLSDYVNLSKDGLKQKLVNTIESFWETTDGSTPMAEKLENTYRKILGAAPNAKLIVAGYPQLIHYDTKISSSLYTDNQSIGELAGDVVLTISDSEAKLIDDAVSTFDQYIKTIVENRMDGENIAFVDVQDAFAGHEAYSDDPYIEGLVLGLSENIDKSGTGSVISSASFHPNEKGAKAYAGAVQELFTQYDENPVLVVCDGNGNPYGDFAVKIDGTQYTEQFLSGSHLTLSMPTSYSQEMNADSTEPLQLSLTKGDYTITVTDQSNPENSISKDIKVRKNYDGKVIRMSGSFGAGNTADAYAAWNPSAFAGKRYEYDDGAVIYEVEFYEKNGATWLSLGSNSSGGTGTGLAGIDIILEANKTSYENVNVIVAGIGVVEANNTLRIVPGENSLFIEWKNESGDTVVAADFYPIADSYQPGNIPSETGLAESSSDVTQTYIGSCGPLQKDGDQYYYSGEIMGYDESLVVDDDWTTGYYTLTSGTFYTDEATKIIIETDSDYGFPGGDKGAAEWLDDFYARKEYWMTVNIKVNGDHIEEILGIYSIC